MIFNTVPQIANKITSAIKTLNYIYKFECPDIEYAISCSLVAFQDEPLPPDNNSWQIQNLRPILKLSSSLLLSILLYCGVQHL